MQRLRALPVAARALLAAATLYGVLLQAFLVAALPVVAAEAGLICAHEATDGRPGGDLPRHDHACCTLAHPQPLVPPPSPGSVDAPVRSIAAITAAPAPSADPTGPPPTHHVSARGPPTV